MQAKTQATIEAIEQRLRNKGQRFTAPRRDVLATLIEHGRAAKAYDILAMMDDVKPMTVYRALDFLVSQGLVHRIESMNAYAACAESHCHHSDSQYLICTSCENIEELHNHAIEHFLHKEIQSTGFAPSSITMEIHGICKNCTAI